MEEPEGAIGYNHVWNVPGRKAPSSGRWPSTSSAASTCSGSTTRPVRRPTGTWTTAYQFKQPGEPNYHARQIADLVDSIRTGRKPLVDGYEGKKSVAILQAVYESNRTGQPVALSGPSPTE